MDDKITRSFLDRLSTEELISLADNYGVDFPPDLERVFMIEQLLDYANEENQSNDEAQDVPPEISFNGGDFPEQASLPKQYNISFMDIIIRDPLWAFVFWELKATEKESLEASPDFGGYYLKVSSLSEEGQKPGTVAYFTVPVGNEDTARYIGFPQEDEAGAGLSKRIELCAEKGGSEISLVSSHVFRLPALAPKKGEVQAEGFERSLAYLSGFDEFPVLRNGDRQSRMKIRGNSLTG